MQKDLTSLLSNNAFCTPIQTQYQDSKKTVKKRNMTTLKKKKKKDTLTVHFPLLSELLKTITEIHYCLLVQTVDYVMNLCCADSLLIQTQ